MFYLETKDGDKFFTDKNSNDKLEFERIIEAKLGKDAANMFNILVADAEGKNEDIIEQAYCRLRYCSDDLDHFIDVTTLDSDASSRLTDILHEINAIINVLDI